MGLPDSYFQINDPLKEDKKQMKIQTTPDVFTTELEMPGWHDPSEVEGTDEWGNVWDLLGGGLIGGSSGITWGGSEALGFDEAGSGLKNWQADQLKLLNAAQKVKTNKRLSGAGKSMALEGVSQAIASLSKPDEGDKGVPYARVDIDDEYDPYGTVA